MRGSDHAAHYDSKHSRKTTLLHTGGSAASILVTARFSSTARLAEQQCILSSDNAVRSVHGASRLWSRACTTLFVFAEGARRPTLIRKSIGPLVNARCVHGCLGVTACVVRPRPRSTRRQCAGARVASRSAAAGSSIDPCVSRRWSRRTRTRRWQCRWGALNGARGSRRLHKNWGALNAAARKTPRACGGRCAAHTLHPPIARARAVLNTRRCRGLGWGWRQWSSKGRSPETCPPADAAGFRRRCRGVVKGTPEVPWQLRMCLAPARKDGLQVFAGRARVANSGNLLGAQLRADLAADLGGAAETVLSKRVTPAAPLEDAADGSPDQAQPVFFGNLPRAAGGRKLAVAC